MDEFGAPESWLDPYSVNPIGVMRSPGVPVSSGSHRDYEASPSELTPPSTRRSGTRVDSVYRRDWIGCARRLWQQQAGLLLGPDQPAELGQWADKFEREQRRQRLGIAAQEDPKRRELGGQFGEERLPERDERDQVVD